MKIEQTKINLAIKVNETAALALIDAAMPVFVG